MNDVITCLSFPDLIEELRAAKQRGARLVSSLPDPQLGQAIGFKLSDGVTFRLTLAKIKQHQAEQENYPHLLPLWNLLSTPDGRARLFLSC